MWPDQAKSLLFECMYACSRSFNDKLTLQRLLNNLLIEFGSKTLNESNSAKNKSIRYFCFVVVVLIYSCHHRLKMSSFSLKRINFGQSIWPAVGAPLSTGFLKALKTSSWEVFRSKGDSIPHRFKYPGRTTWNDVFWTNENFIQQLPAMFTCWRLWT